MKKKYYKPEVVCIPMIADRVMKTNSQTETDEQFGKEITYDEEKEMFFKSRNVWDSFEEDF
ncbi:MAG: hypothetical protein IKI47_06460 [Prevotella sp.]|nr:hypothetical protein [Prevotella sp.]